MRLGIIWVVALLLNLTFAGLTPAEEQFAGEVLKVDTAAKKLTVKKPDGNRFTFVVNDKTAFVGNRRSLQDLTKGDRVTVDFHMSAGQYQALRIASQ
jgi:Cu/Ag efflux protein CusF